MNFLAHATLSFQNEEALVGNMISDFVKGRQQFDYPLGIWRGIKLHRLIDEFTDGHPVNREAREIFRPHYRLYSGAMLDVVYDHFLARDPALYDETSLFAFSQQSYETIASHTRWLPIGFRSLFPYMQKHNWLYGCRERKGIANSLRGVMYRAKYLEESDMAFRLFEGNFQLLQDYYRQFWDDLLPYAKREFEKLLDQGDRAMDLYQR